MKTGVSRAGVDSTVGAPQQRSCVSLEVFHIHILEQIGGRMI